MVSKEKMPQSRVGSMQGSIEGRLLIMKPSFSDDHPPPKAVFHRSLITTKGHLPPTDTDGRLPLKVVFHRGLSATKGRLPPKVVFYQRLSSTKGHLQSKVVYDIDISVCATV